MTVGKRVGRSTYVGFDAIRTGQSDLDPQLIKSIRTANWRFGKDFKLDVVCVEPHARVRMLEMSDMGDPHPHVAQSYVMLDGNPDKVEPGCCRGQIYHRLDLILNPEHKWYTFHKRVREFEEDAGLLGPHAPKSIGYPSIWRNWVSKHMAWDDYCAKIAEIKKSCEDW